MKDNPFLSVGHLSFAYPDTRSVLNGVSLSLQGNEKVALIGPNGSGKTTLFMLLCGILKPQSGTITVGDKPIEYGSFNPSISYLFQSPDDQLFSSTVLDDVAFGPLNMEIPAEEVKSRSMAALSAVGCSQLIDRPPHHLSGGEKRLVAMATVLSMDPQILLLDEPVSNLDGRNRRKVIEIINKIDSTLFIASHDLEFLLETCERVILMDGGDIIAAGKIRDVFANEEILSRHGMEKPHSLTSHRGTGHRHDD